MSTTVLYMFEARLSQGQLSNEEFYSRWLSEAEYAASLVEAGVIKSAYKVPGEHRVVVIADLDSPERIDDVIHSLPLFKNGLWPHVQHTWTPLRLYADWTEDLKALACGQTPVRAKDAEE